MYILIMVLVTIQYAYKENKIYFRNPYIPEIGGRLRKNLLRLPEAIHQASGIVINGRRIRSFVFTTDLAITRNCDADAVFAVYPFTPQQAISDAIIKASCIPVFCGEEVRLKDYVQCHLQKMWNHRELWVWY